MGNPIGCDLCEGVQADVLVSQVATGDVLAVCADCLPTWAQVVLDTVPGATPTPAGAGDAIPAATEDPPDGPPGPAPAPPAPAPARKAKAAAPATKAPTGADDADR